MQNRNILTVLTPDSVETNGKFNQASGDRFVANGEFDKAFAVYMISAKEGYAPCQNSIGFAYDCGEGVRKDEAEAARWYKMAADQNHPEAQFNLAYSYFKGTGVQQSEQEGMKYLLQAADNNHPIALFNVGSRLDDSGDKNKAFVYYKRSAEIGYSSAQYNLALCYLRGEGTSCDNEEGTYWIKQAAKNGLEDAISLLRKNNIPF